MDFTGLETDMTEHVSRDVGVKPFFIPAPFIHGLGDPYPMPGDWSVFPQHKSKDIEIRD